MDMLPKMMTIHEIANTGLLPEAALRRLLKQGKLPAEHIGRKALINYTKLCLDLQNIRYALKMAIYKASQTFG
jgi:hypothetical protein